MKNLILILFVLGLGGCLGETSPPSHVPTGRRCTLVNDTLFIITTTYGEEKYVSYYKVDDEKYMCQAVNAIMGQTFSAYYNDKAKAEVRKEMREAQRHCHQVEPFDLLQFNEYESCYYYYQRALEGTLVFFEGRVTMTLEGDLENEPDSSFIFHDGDDIIRDSLGNEIEQANSIKQVKGAWITTFVEQK